MGTDVRDNMEQAKPLPQLQIYPTLSDGISPFWRGFSLSLSQAMVLTEILSIFKSVFFFDREV